MKGRDTVVEYDSSDGEKIKIVCGQVVRHGAYRHFKNTTTRVYVNKKLIEEYFFNNRDMNLDMIPEMRFRLEELAEAGACSEEIISAIDNIISNECEYDGIRIDDSEEVPLTKIETEIASHIHQDYFARYNKRFWNYLHII